MRAYLRRWAALVPLLVGGCHWLQEPSPRPEPSIEVLEDRCVPSESYVYDYEACARVGPMLVEAGRVDRAIQVLNRGCHRVPSACTDLALLYVDGKVVERDLKEAAMAVGGGCMSPRYDPDACGWYGFLLMRNMDETAVSRRSLEPTLDKACRYGDSDWGCYNYGVALACGFLGPPDYKHADNVLTMACALGDSRGCLLRERLKERPEPPPCTLMGPDPKHPVELGIEIVPLAPGAKLPPDKEPYQRLPMGFGG